MAENDCFFVLVIGISCGFLYVAHCGIVRLVESDSYNLALKYAELPASDKVYPASCTYEDGLFHVTLIPETEEACEVIYKWLEYEEDGEFGLVMKNNLKADKELRCVGGKEIIEMQYDFHAKKGQARCAFGEVHEGETFIYTLADYLEEDFGENYPELMQGDYRMNYVLCSHETGELELLSVPFSVPAEGPFKVWWFSANRH